MTEVCPYCGNTPICEMGPHIVGRHFVWGYAHDKCSPVTCVCGFPVGSVKEALQHLSEKGGVSHLMEWVTLEAMRKGFDA